MNTPTPAGQRSSLKKSVLLVDVHMGTRESRAANLRKLGVTVDSASTAATALAQFGTGSYHLVLIDMGHDRHGAEQLASDIRLQHPAQQIGFMVEGPTLISKTLGPERPTAIPAAVRRSVPALADTTESAFARAVKDAEERQQSAMPNDF